MSSTRWWSSKIKIFKGGGIRSWWVSGSVSSIVLTHEILVILAFVLGFDCIEPVHGMVFCLSWLWSSLSTCEKLVKDTSLERLSLFCYVSIDLELQDGVDWNFKSNLYDARKDNFCVCVDLLLFECNWNAILEVVKG